MLRYLSISLIFLWTSSLIAQDIWSASTYPDEAGFTQRKSPFLQKLANKGFGERSLASSKCPDTGLPVKTWALEGETIISPYTGTAYKQGPTGYFGPKARNQAGEIIAFGGDPLKYDLPPAIAQMLLHPDDTKTKAFLSIPGNLRQQYHFACTNWARFFPLLADQMGDDWKKEFYLWTAAYSEARRPSDGYREQLPLSHAHNLVGEEGFLLGGNPIDGGTENHKTMWRTSALLYSQLFPDTAKISGYPVKEVEKLTKEMLRDYLKRLLITGNGEYDSQVYYPYSIEGFLNLYDFSPDEETRQLAKFALDYYFLTYGLKVIEGTIAGGQKRGYLATSDVSKMESLIWLFFDNTSRDMSEADINIHQLTTTYRPNKVIWNILRKEIPLPFSAKISRPFYHMDKAHAFVEDFYCSKSYAMGSVQMTIVDNPNQQMVWSLVAEGENGPLCFSGGHPMRQSTSGHSPYTQTLQSDGSLILLTAPTQKVSETDTNIAPNYQQTTRPNLWHLPDEEQGKDFEIRNRQKYAAEKLFPLTYTDIHSPSSLDQFWIDAKKSACSFLYFPKHLSPQKEGEYYLFETPNSFIALKPIGDTTSIIQPSDEVIVNMKNRSAKRFFSDYVILAVGGETSGYIIETAEKEEFNNAEEYIKSLNQHTKLAFTDPTTKTEVLYTNRNNQKLRMRYESTGLRCSAWRNDKKVKWDTYTTGAVYESPYLQINNGKMIVSDGIDGYEVDFRSALPIWKSRKN